MLNGLIAMDERERMVPIDRAALVEAVAHLLTDDRSVTKLRHAGIGLVALGEYDRAESILREALAGAEAADDVRSRIAVRINLADACRYRDKLTRARPLYVEALRLAQAQCPELVDFALQHLGKLHLDRADRVAARECLAEALSLRWAKGDPELIASTERALRLLD